MVEGAFSANTLRAWRADWEIFVEWREGLSGKGSDG
jgi:hypothetical protein